VFGLHRFYVSKIGTAVTMLVLTLTFVGIIVTSIWAFIDLIMIASGNFKDKEGRYIKK
jgi:TM2 domain-containing membrane protein YozV